MIKIFLFIIISLFSNMTYAYEILGYDGILLAPNTQTQINNISTANMLSGILVFNQDTATYQMWNGQAWVELVPKTTIEVFRASDPKPAINNSLTYFTDVEIVLANRTCGDVVSSAASGTYFEALTACQLTGTVSLTADNEGYFGFAINPSASELLDSFENLPISKKLCIARWQGIKDYTTSCGFQTAVRAGDRVYLQTFPSVKYSTKNHSMIQILTTTLGAGATGLGPSAGTGDVTGPASSVVDNIPTFANISGKVIKDSGVPIASVMTQDTVSTGTDYVTLSAGANRKKKDSEFKIPSKVCNSKEILVSNGKDYVCAVNTGGGGIGSPSSEDYYASEYAGTSSGNLGALYFKSEVGTPSVCYTVENNISVGLKITMVKNCAMLISFIATNSSVSYSVGLTKNPTFAEISGNFEMVQDDKKYCNTNVLGIAANTNSCSVLIKAVAADIFYLHARPGLTIGQPKDFSITITGKD